MRAPDDPTYRVYTPTELQSIAPATFRGAPPPRARGWFGFGFVLFVGLVISGASFGALRYFKVDLDLSGGRTSLGASTDPVTPLVIPPPPPAASGEPDEPSSIGPPSPSAKTHHKVHGIRRTSAPPSTSILNLPRAPVVRAAPAAPVAPARAPTPAPAAPLPPNPF